MKLFIGSIQQETAFLSEEESHHFVKVLRGRLGENIAVTNGLGQLAKGVVSNLHPKKVAIEIEEKWTDFEKKNYSLHIAIAPTKNMDRLEFFLEKAVEIGIDEITFLQTFNSERKNLNLERCQKIVQSATKQSLKAYIPKVNDLIKFKDFIQNPPKSHVLIAHCDPEFERFPVQEIVQPKENYLIMIGPEGDFSKDEIQLAQKNNFINISLGKQRFRTETAALEAVFALDWINQIV